MIGEIWQAYLYQPLFNLLIWIYNNWTSQNLGWAVVYLTILLRIVLLPFTLVTEKTKINNKALEDEITRLDKELHNDPILKKEEIRKVLRKRKIRPWARAVVIVVLVLTFLLLYQVFLRGITGEKILQLLYPTVDFPGRININFYGFDLGQRHTYFWPGIVGLILLSEIYLELKSRRNIQRSDLFYFIFFPLATFLFLWWLPMVKSLFILTSLLFSHIIHFVSLFFFAPKKPKPVAHH